MTTFLVVLLCIAILAVLVGTVMLLVEAFRESVLWGMAYLFVPFANLAFVICHWDRARKGFLVSIVGAVAAIGATFSLVQSPEMARAKVALLENLARHRAPANRSQDLTAKLQAVRDRIAEIESNVNESRPELIRQFNELAARRKSLPAEDATAIGKFNEEAAAYQKLNAKRKALLDELKVANQELTDLLAAQAKAQEKRVVMYTTASCPACKVAKQYFAQKGVPFEEIDVQRSPAGAEEFRRLGGRGVPLIMIGEKRVEGFNAKAIEAML